MTVGQPKGKRFAHGQPDAVRMMANEVAVHRHGCSHPAARGQPIRLEDLDACQGGRRRLRPGGEVSLSQQTVPGR